MLPLPLLRQTNRGTPAPRVAQQLFIGPRGARFRFGGRAVSRICLNCSGGGLGLETERAGCRGSPGTEDCRQDSGQPKGPYRKRAGRMSTRALLSSLPLASLGLPLAKPNRNPGTQEASLWPVSLPRCRPVKRESGHAEANKASLMVHVDPELKGHKACWGWYILTENYTMRQNAVSAFLKKLFIM